METQLSQTEGLCFISIHQYNESDWPYTGGEEKVVQSTNDGLFKPRLVDIPIKYVRAWRGGVGHGWACKGEMEVKKGSDREPLKSICLKHFRRYPQSFSVKRHKGEMGVREIWITARNMALKIMLKVISIRNPRLGHHTLGHLWAAQHISSNVFLCRYDRKKGKTQVDDSGKTLRELWRAKLETVVLPSLKDFAPDLILLSAGFDAHKDDPVRRGPY